MKFNWGTGIAVAYGTFAVGMIALVFASRKYDPGLVQKDYYTLDLNYQDRLERKQNTAALPAAPQASVQQAEKLITIQFPPDMSSAKGTAKFYRSTTTKDDFQMQFDNGQPLQVNTGPLPGGRWHVEMEWEANGKKYFWESAVTI